MRIAVGAAKGGTGKTTTAVMLALLLARLGPTLFVDADRQRSATAWKLTADADGWLWPDTLRWDPAGSARAGEHVVTDTGPGDVGRFLPAVDQADAVIVPSGARPADVAQLGHLMGQVAPRVRSGALYGALVTMARLGTRYRREAPAAIDAADLGRFDTIIPLREDYARAFGTVPEWTGAYADLLTEIEKGLI